MSLVALLTAMLKAVRTLRTAQRAGRALMTWRSTTQRSCQARVTFHARTQERGGGGGRGGANDADD